MGLQQNLLTVKTKREHDNRLMDKSWNIRIYSKAGNGVLFNT